MNTDRALHTSTALNTGEVLVAGGIANTSSGESLANAELVNPARGKMEAYGEHVGGSRICYRDAATEGRSVGRWRRSQRQQQLLGDSRTV